LGIEVERFLLVSLSFSSYRWENVTDCNRNTAHQPLLCICSSCFDWLSPT